MCYLSSRQYRLLKTLIEVDKPLSMTALGGKVKLASRRVNYKSQRVRDGKYAVIPAEQLAWLKSHPLWAVAAKIALRLAESPYEEWPDEKVALIVMYLLSALRNERWPGDLEVDSALENTLKEMMQQVVEKYPHSNLPENRILYDGILNLLFPAYYRQRFGIWLPQSSSNVSMIEHYGQDVKMAEKMVDGFFTRTGIRLPDENVMGMTMLLRAAILREQADQQQEVLVICPSGMATAQLLAARSPGKIIIFPQLPKLP